MTSVWNEAGPAQTRAALALALAMSAIIAAVWTFQWMGYAPCQLCLEQRVPYYWGIPIVAFGALSGALGWPACIVRGALMIGVLCLIATAMIGGYHAGVEWGWWEGPASCGAGLSAQGSDAGGLLDSLASAVPPKCDEAAGRFLGLSFAGWNVVVATVLAVLAGRVAFGKTA